MLFIETSVFTRQITSLLSDEEYGLLQQELTERPDTGPVIPGAGGLRKIRWSLMGRGKRGGIRVIYYWVTENEEIFMLLAYGKNEQADLTAEQKKQLRRLVEEWLK